MLDPSGATEQSALYRRFGQRERGALRSPRGCQSPVATGRAGSVIHSLHEPTYRAASMPATESARTSLRGDDSRPAVGADADVRNGADRGKAAAKLVRGHESAVRLVVARCRHIAGTGDVPRNRIHGLDLSTKTLWCAGVDEDPPARRDELPQQHRAPA